MIFYVWLLDCVQFRDSKKGQTYSRETDCFSNIFLLEVYSHFSLHYVFPMLDYVLLLNRFDLLCGIGGFGILISATDWKTWRPCGYWGRLETEKLCSIQFTTLIAFIAAKDSL